MVAAAVAIPFTGQAYADRSRDANAQTCVNLYPVISPTPDEPNRVILYPTPGLSLFVDTTGLSFTGAGAIRGGYEINGALYIISGNRLLKYDGSTWTAVGTLNTYTSRCSIQCNTVELAISDGSDGYTYNLGTGSFATISGGSWPASGGVTNFTFIDGYLLAAVNNSRQVIQSNLLAGGTYGAQAYVNTTSTPDNNVAVFSDQLQLYVFGPKVTEVRFNSGATPFAFEKSSGVLIQAGCVAWPTIVKVGSTVIWLASDDAGRAYVAALEGYTPKVLSTPPINEAIERYGTISDAFAYSYREADNQFYVITFPSAGVTWAYEVKTQAWHQRSAPGGGRDYADVCVQYQGRNLVGGSDGKLYWMSQEYLTGTSGGYYTRERTCSHVSADGKPLFLHELRIDIEAGVGLLSGQGSDPLAWLDVSRDGGNTWVSAGTASMGRLGEYRRRLTWRRLGWGWNFTFRLRVTDPVRTVVLGASALVTAGLK